MRAARQAGYILLPVTIMIAVIAAIALLINYESSLETNTTVSELDSRRAEYVAEAGFAHGSWLAAQQGCGPYTDLVEMLGADQYDTKLTTDLGATSSYTLVTDHDAWLDGSNTDANNGNDTGLHLRFVGGDIERPVYRYDLSPLPAKATILSATAWFFVTSEHPEGPANVHRLTADWTEADATWDSLGSQMDPAVLVTIPAQPVKDVWVSVNLTSQVQAWVNGEPNQGIAFDSRSEGTDGEYSSKEHASAPFITVVVGTTPSPLATLEASAKLANGVGRTIKRKGVVLYQDPPGMLYLQPDASIGQDAEIWDQAPNNNYGAAQETWVSSAASDTTRTLLRFDVGAIPAGAKILRAQLSLQHWSGAGSDQPISAHRLTNPWSEDSVTWNRRQTGVNWDTAGGDFDATAIATTPVGPLDQRYDWDIAPLVQGWVDGRYPNHGFALVAAVAGLPGERFYTSDHADADLHPDLTVTYTCACGIVCVPPGGSGRIAMIGNFVGPGPDPRDEEREAVIESWGYQVDPHDDNFIWAIDFDDYDLVYVSETASSGAVSGQLSWRSIGIVNEQGNLNFDLGLAGDKATTTGDAIEITDTGHYVTRPFAPGTLAIYRADMEILTASGAEAPDLQTLAEAGGVASLYLIEKGATTLNGAAPGRRATLPLGRVTNSNFNWTHLNNNGRLLVQRTIEWALGGDVISQGNLLLVVADDGNLTAQEDAKIALFESWGWVVSVIDDNDSQASYDAAAALNDVVYIGEDINSGTLGTKLAGATIGIVTEEDNLSDEFGFSDGIHWDSGTTLDLVGTHYITEPLPNGSVTILTATEALADLTGSLAPNIQLIGNNAAGAALAVLETGAALNGGGNAAGRRVYLPWGGNDMDINHLNADGLTILERSLEWANGASLDLAPIAHWKLDDGAGSTAIDSEGNHDGSLANGPAWTPGLIDGGLDFDGAGDHVQVNHSTEFEIAEGSITLWIKADNVGDEQNLFYKDGSDKMYLRIKDGEINYQTSGDTLYGPVAADEWHFVAVSFGSGGMKLYLDGDLVASNAKTDGMVLNSGPLYIGADNSANKTFGGVLDDIRVYDYALAAGDIADLYADNAPVAPGYTGLYAPWSATDPDTWEAVDLSGFGVPPNAVVEIAVINTDNGKEHLGGVRAIGSSLERWLLLHEPESGGADVITLHVQADSSSRIEHYSAKTGDVSFVLLGYWTGAAYVERFDSFNAGGSGSWRDVSLAPYGVGADQVAEVAAVNTSGGSERYAGLRRNGSGLGRLLELHEAEAGGVDAGAIWVATDGGATIEAFAESNGDIDFYLLGYWSTPPGTFTEAAAILPGAPASSGAWHSTDLSGLGLPADAVAQILLANTLTGAETEMGVREVGSSLDRLLDLQEAENGGNDLATLHVVADAAARIEWYDQQAVGGPRFLLTGWWQLSP